MNIFLMNQENSNIATIEKIEKIRASLLKPTMKASIQVLVFTLYEKEATSNNANEFLKFFSYPVVKYYGVENASENFILKDKEKYFREWKHRYYENIKVEIGSILSYGKIVEVKVVFDYQLDNGIKQLEGESKHLLTMEKINGKYLITSIELDN